MLVSNVFKSAGIKMLELWTTKTQDVEKLLYWQLQAN
jgi:hypothetical protein